MGYLNEEGKFFQSHNDFEYIVLDFKTTLCILPH